MLYSLLVCRDCYQSVLSHAACVEHRLSFSLAPGVFFFVFFFSGHEVSHGEAQVHSFSGFLGSHSKEWTLLVWAELPLSL